MTNIDKIYSYCEDTVLENDCEEEYVYPKLERIAVYRHDDKLYVYGRQGRVGMTESEFIDMVSYCYKHYKNKGKIND